MKKICAVLFLIILSVCVFAEYRPDEGEIRGIWINSDKMPKTEAETKALVEEYHRAGFNLLFPEVMCRGYAVFPSEILERDPRFTQSCDMLAEMIKYAHALNMEVHPWVWCFRAGYTNHPGAIIKAHPEWLEIGRYGGSLSLNGGMWISPISAEARAFLTEIYKEIAGRYDIDGFHLDYVRYESQTPVPFGFSFKARQTFISETGCSDPKISEYLSPDYIRWMEFREKYIDIFVKDIYTELKKIKPDIIISAAVAMDPDEARINYMQNWPHWAENGWIDMIVPMTYVTDDRKLIRNMDKQLKVLRGKVWTAVGLGPIYFVNDEKRNIGQIELARKTDYMGQALFASQYMTDSLEKMLRESVWTDNALLPFGLNTEKNSAIKDYKSDITEKEPLSLSQVFPKEILPIPVYTVRKRITDISVNGMCDSPEWAPYNEVIINHNNMGDMIEDYTSRVRMTYDKDALYVCFVCEEPKMHAIKAEAEERDGNTFYDDSAEVFVQMNPTALKYNHFSVNTKNTQFDQQIYNVSWSKDWKSSVKKYSDRWCCEIRIPFKELSVDTPKEGALWRMNFTRNRTVGGQVENLCWSVTYGSFHTAERFGYVYFE